MYKEILEKLNFKKSYDVRKRVLSVNGKKIILIFLDFLTDSLKVNNIIYSILSFNNGTININALCEYLMAPSLSIKELEDDIIWSILKGDIAIFLEDEKKAIIIDTKKYPGRLTSEPDSEKVVRGSRDGFTETLSTNVALIRRRIASTELVFEFYSIGTNSNTGVSLVYLKNAVNKSALKKVQEQLKTLNVKELTMSDKALEEHLIKSPYSPYPLVKYTERPDTFSAHLYQGMFGVLVDTSPSAILGPVSIFDHMQHAEEFRQTIIAGSYLRFIRFLGIISGFLILPIWFALFSIGYFTLNFSLTEIFFQIIIIELSIEVIRMASIHTPSALSQSMGLIAGIVLGDMATEIGLIHPQIAFLAAISALSSYITPSYELSLANKIVNLLLLLSIFLFKIYGLIFGLLGLTIYLACLKSFNRPYLYPLIPFNFKDFMKQVFRKPYV